MSMSGEWEKDDALAVLTADWHLTRRQPISRTDNYWETLQRKVIWIVDLCNELGVPMYHAGDLFDRAMSHPTVERFAIEQLSRVRNGVYIVAGNHDAPYHDLSLLPDSSFGVAEAGVKWHNVHMVNDLGVVGCAWSGDFEAMPSPGKGPGNVLIAHHMIGGGEEAAWLKEHAEEAERFLRRYSRDYDLIVTGHNHHQFVAERRGKFLVNPGSIARTNKDQKDHEPAVFVWCLDDASKERYIQRVPIPCEPADDVLQDVGERKRERVLDIDEFVAKLKQESSSGVSFVRNLENYIHENELDADVSRAVWEIVGEDRS